MDGMQWLRSIRGRLTTLSKRVKALEQVILQIDKRLKWVEKYVIEKKKRDVEDWT